MEKISVISERCFMITLTDALLSCHATSMSYERLATTKLSKEHFTHMRFLFVNLGGNNQNQEFMGSLNIQGLPMEILYHSSVGVLGEVGLERGNLSQLKRGWRSG